MRIVIVLVAVALLVPAAQAQRIEPEQSTPTTLYFHVFDTFNKFPINTQPMDVDFFDVGGTNFPTLAAQGYDFNTIYGYSTAGLVEYGFIENGRPRFHPEHGLASDVRIDPAVQPVVYLYVDLRDVVANNIGPMVLPAYTFEVTVRTGDDPGDTAKLDAGRLLMHGSLTAHLFDGQAAGDANEHLAGQSDPDGHPILVPDEHGIIEYAIPLDVKEPIIKKDDSYNIRIDWYQDPGGAAGRDQVATGWMRLAADHLHLPRLEMNVLNPVYIEFIHPQVAAGTLLIHMGVNSPWGTYDLDVANMTLEVTGPSTPVDLQRFVSQGLHVHNQHDKAAEITYMWPFRAENAANGDYDIRVTVPNLRGNAEVTGTAGFTVEGKRAFGTDESGNVVEPVGEDTPDKKSPGVGAAALLVAIALAGRRSA